MRTIELDRLPAGYSMANVLEGESAPVRLRGVVSSEDGGIFIRLLEGVSSAYAPAFGPDGVPPSQVDHFLAVIRPDRQATLYCNELSLTPRIRVNRTNPDGIKVGELIYLDDIADVEDMEVHDRAGNLIQIPADHGFCLILSHHWRKAMVFDYSVFGPSGRPRTEDPSRLFGHVYARLLFQEMYATTDAQWARLFEWGWFPFVGIRHDHRRQLLSWVATARYPAPLLEEICRTFTSDLDARLENWKRYELLERQMGFFAIARDRFQAGDHVSCISVLYPRIEGVMRSLYDQENPGHRAGQEEMVTNLVENQYLTSMLLPQRFRDYLRAVYFENFNLSSGEIPLSRHSHAHGVSQLGDYNLIRAAVGFMIVDQLFHYLSD